MSDRPPRPASPARDEATIVVRNVGGIAFRPGTVLGHTYVIEALLARGETGDLYRARHAELATRHAIKVIAPALATDPALVQSLADEARKLSRVRDDAVASYEGLFRGERALRYVVSEYVEGETLAKVLERRRLEPDEVRHLRERLAQGLAAAHDNGIVHARLSPDTIILPDGKVERAKLVGFGLTKPGAIADATLVGAAAARKFAFMSPEQTGLFGGRVDARSDIYSLGLVLAAAAIGFGKTLALGAAPAAAIAARRQKPDLSPVPAALRPVIAPLLEPRPEDRPGSMRQVLAAAREQPRRQPPARPFRVRPFAVVSGVVAVVAVAVAVWWLRAAPPSPPAEEIRARVAVLTEGYQCAALAYDVATDRSVRLSGHVSAAADLERLKRTVTDIPGIGTVRSEVSLMPRPYCDIAAVLAPSLARPNGGSPSLSLVARELRIGDPLLLEVRTPAFDGYVYLDYFDGDGDEVHHLIPTARERFNLKPGRNHFVLGCPPGPATISLGGKPGQRAITLIATAKPLFPGPRVGSERVRDYLADLADAIGRLPEVKTASGLLLFDLQAEGPAAAAACPAR